MKIMFASDIHGSEYYCRRMQELYEKEGAGKLVLLGDLLYHGPRNDLPRSYNPKGVIEILNGMRDEILCVRGNCDSEVDQMVLNFPIMAEYMVLFVEERMMFVTHGHIHNKEKLPMLKHRDILIHGHTHIQAMEDNGDYLYINPGSISIPKEDNLNSYMILEGGTFTIKDLDHNIIKSMRI